MGAFNGLTFTKGNIVCLAGAVGLLFLPAIVLHMIVDLFAALYQRAVVPLWLCEAWAVLWGAVIVCIAVKLCGKMKAQPMNDCDL